MKPQYRFQLLTLTCAIAVFASPVAKSFTVTPSAETVPVGSTGDAADDPVVVVNHEKPESSWIVGTNKNVVNGGLQVYRLDGSVADTVADPALNNVDARENFPFLFGKGVLIGATRRSDSSLALYTIDIKTGKLKNVESKRLKSVESYGFCLGFDPKTEQFYAYVNEKSGTITQWRLFPTAEGTVDGERVRTLKVATQPEGMAIDDETGTLFVGEEIRGIWKFGAWPDQPFTGELIDSIYRGGVLKADVEGMDIFKSGHGEGYLVVSNQGNHNYVLYNRKAPHERIGSFKIGDSKTIDGTGETDGLAVCSSPLGTLYPEGILVVQDGFNKPRKAGQNFKIIDWRMISKNLK